MQQARNILESTCEKVGGYTYQANVSGQPNGTWNSQSGYGRVNAYNAVINALSGIANIVGPTLICNTADYSMSILSPSSNVVWSIPSSAGSVLQLAQNTPEPNKCRITNQKWYGVNTTLTATISNIGCGIPTSTITKNIANDNDVSASTPFAYYQEACNFYNVSHPSQSGTIYSNSSPVFVHQGCMVYVNLGDMTGRTVSLASGSGTPMTWTVGTSSYYQNTLFFQLPLGSGGIPFTFNIIGDGACYQKSLLFFSIGNNGFTAFPNPASNTVNIESSKSNEKSSPTREIREVVLINKMGSISYRKQFGKGVLNVNIPVAQLKNDIYVLKISDGKNWQTEKLVVQH